MTSDGVLSYAYDAANRLASVSSNGVVLVANQYDYRNRRIRKTTQTAETTFVYDDWNLIHETVTTVNGSTTNTTEIQYFWGMDLPETLQGAGGVGGLLAVSRNGLFYFPAYDNNGNVTKYIDENGNVVAAYEYDDFGRLISQTGTMADIFRHRFSTKYFDVETGLYYYGYRFYSPSLMRWLNRDPIEEEGGLNLYGFCGNSAIHLFDNLGKRITIIEDNSVVKDRINTTARAAFFPSAPISFSCTWNGVLRITGSAYRRIEILTPNLPRWNQRMRRYDNKWGKNRSNTTEWRAAYAHEMDHWNSYNAFFAFLHLLNEFDGTHLCNKCNEMKDELERQYNIMWSNAIQHSARYDTRNYNYGGAYPSAKP